MKVDICVSLLSNKDNPYFVYFVKVVLTESFMHRRSSRSSLRSQSLVEVKRPSKPGPDARVGLGSYLIWFSGRRH